MTEEIAVWIVIHVFLLIMAVGVIGAVISEFRDGMHRW